jgi:hypothetical protein
MLYRALAAILLCACAQPAENGADPDPPIYLPMPVPPILDRALKPSRVIYLNREGARLVPGSDEASRNQSGIVALANVSSFDVPAYRGTPRQWDTLVSCIRGHFAPYDVDVVDQRPVAPGYMMAMFGGEPGVLASTVGAHSHGVTGLAPFSGQPVENAVVLIFTRTMRENGTRTCETAAMEIAHAFGLDHAMHCGDVMSYLRPCGRRRFQDRAVPCGEHEERECGNGEASQSSHRRLLEVLGAREE